MKRFFQVLLTFVGLVFFCSAPVIVHADAKSDYEFQFSRYRQNFIEYSILKQDFLENPTLDNQQKAVLAAKDTLKSRDLAKANFSLYLLSICQEKQTNFAPIKPILDSLTSAKNYFLSSADRSQSIVTPTDLTSFTNDYLANTVIHDRSFRTGIVACKLSQLVRIQRESKNALDVILPRLSTPFSASLQGRIDELQTSGNNINTLIDTFTGKLFTEEDIQNIDSENYFQDKSEAVKKIQTLQLRWVNSLIDIDLNYAHS